MQSGVQRFGMGRLMAILGVAAGVAAVAAAIILNLVNQPQALLYSNLDLKEANEITASLDQQGIRYQVKGDGSTILVNRDEVAAARLMLSAKGLPTAGSVGYELFDKAPALGQTEFVQNLNQQRAIEGELARTIRSLRGLTSARVHLVMPKRELFREEAAAPTASVVVGLSGSELTGDQIRAIRNLVASAVPNLKPDNVTLVDDKNRLLAAGGEGDTAMGASSERKNEVEEALRKRVKDIVEGIVGIGNARVTVTAELDTKTITRKEERFDPDGQVVRSSRTSEASDSSTEGNADGAATANANIPEGQEAAGANPIGSQSGQNEEVTNFEISNTVTTEVQAPGAIKKLAVAVVVDGVTTPATGNAQPGYTPRAAEEMQRIEQLVQAAIGFDQERGDVVSVANVRFNRDVGAIGGTSAGAPLMDFTKNDIMRAVEIAVLLIVAILIILFVARPLLKAAGGGAAGNPLANAMGAAGNPALAIAGATGGAAGQLALPGVEGGQSGVLLSPVEERIDMARIEGQVKASSVKKVSEFVDRHPEESLSILRSWLQDS